MGLKRPRLILLILVVALAATATVIAVSGGFRTTVGGFRVSMRSPLAASIGGLLVAGAWLVLARRAQAVTADLEASWQFLERHASRFIGGVALIAAIVAATFATRSAAGADASGYLSQAKSTSGIMPPIYIEQIAEGAPELDGWITTPLGWRPGSDAALCDVLCDGLQVPTYPPGLPLLMALPHSLAGVDGANAVVVASTAAAVWATGMIVGGVSGVLAAVLLAGAPVFLYQSIQPMSDVPVTAAWMLTFLLIVRGGAPVRTAIAGLVCGLAVLIRPNLAPLAIVPFLVSGHKTWFALPVGLAGAFLAFTNWFLYGSPLRSGYGEASELFALANTVPNLQRYFGWLVATSPVLLLAPVGLVRLADDRRARGMAAFASLVVVAYLVYATFDQWSYLRFLLPAMAVFAVLSAVALAGWVERSPVAWRGPMIVVLVLAVAAHGAFVARARDTFTLADQLRRVEQAADFIAKYGGGAENPAVISGEQSGAIRYYTRQPIIRWEATSPEAMRTALGAIERSGHTPYIALDAWEQELFLKKFASIAELQLDWPPMLEAGSSHRTKVWRTSDRARFLAGTQLETVRLP